MCACCAIWPSLGLGAALRGRDRALAGLVAWTPALAMMAAATAGGYLGAPLARALPDSVVRGVIIATGGLMTAIFALRALA